MAASPPVFTVCSPAYGTIAGGTAVVITGTYLTGTTGITFGGATPASFTVDTDTQISTTSPAHAEGPVNVVITTPGGTATGTNGYLYATLPNFVNFSATVRARILAAAASLGGVQQVLDRDEDPAIIAKNSKSLPTICVIPIGAEKLTGQLSFGSDDVQEDFQQVIVGYYRQSQNNKTPYTDINLMRQYGKNCADLFSGQANCQFNSTVILRWTLEIVPYQEMDYVLDRWVLTLSCKSFEY